MLMPRYDWTEAAIQASHDRITKQLDAMNEANRLHRIYNQTGRCPVCAGPITEDHGFFCTIVSCNDKGCTWSGTSDM